MHIPEMYFFHDEDSGGRSRVILPASDRKALHGGKKYPIMAGMLLEGSK